MIIRGTLLGVSGYIYRGFRVERIIVNNGESKGKDNGKRNGHWDYGGLWGSGFPRTRGSSLGSP